MPRQVSTVIIGAGIGGVAAAQALLERGQRDVLVVDRAERPGGVWQANTYPGLACDVPSVAYSFSFAPNPDWTRRFSPGAEIQAYVVRVVEEYGIGDHMRLGSTVVAARFVEDTGRWCIELADGEELQAEVLVTATGQLSRPTVPDLAGLDTFEGSRFHSARWPDGERLEGRRVAVIGTGASAIQFAPAIAPGVAHMTIFQRSAPWIIPKLDTGYGVVTRALYRRSPRVQLLARRFWLGLLEALAPNFTLQPPLAARAIRALFIPLATLYRRLQLRADEDLVSSTTPDYPMGAKRVLMSRDWYPNLRRRNVELCTQPIERVVPDGVVTADGSHHAIDAMVFATGFTATDFLAPMDVVGREGQSIHENWEKGAEAYLGMSVPGFPNLFIVQGPNTFHGTGSIFEMVEPQARYVAQAVDLLARDEVEHLEVRQHVHDRFAEEMHERLAGTIWAQATSYYRTSTGRITTQWPGTYEEYRRRVRRLEISDFETAQSP